MAEINSEVKKMNKNSMIRVRLDGDKKSYVYKAGKFLDELCTIHLFFKDVQMIWDYGWLEEENGDLRPAGFVRLCADKGFMNDDFRKFAQEYLAEKFGL